MLNNLSILKDFTAKNKIIVKLVKSLIGRKKDHIKCAHSLGLRKTNSEKELYATDINLGKIKKIGYMLDIKEVGNEA